jgi:hypothetical protein
LAWPPASAGRFSPPGALADATSLHLVVTVPSVFPVAGLALALPEAARVAGQVVSLSD